MVAHNLCVARGELLLHRVRPCRRPESSGYNRVSSGDHPRTCLLSAHGQPRVARMPRPMRDLTGAVGLSGLSTSEA